MPFFKASVQVVRSDNAQSGGSFLRQMVAIATAGATAAVGLVAVASPAGAATVEAQTVTVEPGALAAASFTITPDSKYVGGQALRFAGNIGVSGERQVTLQQHMGRPGDEWVDRDDGFSRKTTATGDFSFFYSAPSMFGISFRVVSGTYATPAVEFQALSSDLILWVTGDDRDDPEDIGSAVVDEPFGISVDTTPFLRRRPDTIGLLPIRGRELTLQRRVEGQGDKWVTLATSAVKADGMGYFTGVSESAPGEVVYRVRAEDWTRGANEIGWFPSFPTYITISGEGVESGPAMALPAAPRSSVDDVPARVDTGGGSTTASQRYGWAPSRYDFAWESGESLTSKPYRGLQKKGWWLDYTDGGARVSKHNGGLMLDSKRLNDIGPGDFGTSMATLQGNPLTYGRWETRIRIKSDEYSDEDYQIRVDLVPNGDQDDACRTITVAEFTPHGDTVRFGANASTKQWTGSEQFGDFENASIAFAVEVAPDHISWFLEGEPMGTVQNTQAISGVPLTMRLSMVGGATQQEMNHTDLISDWQRGFTLASGEQVKTGTALVERDLEDC